jgi:hypothetical protein
MLTGSTSPDLQPAYNTSSITGGPAFKELPEHLDAVRTLGRFPRWLRWRPQPCSWPPTNPLLRACFRPSAGSCCSAGVLGMIRGHDPTADTLVPEQLWQPSSPCRPRHPATAADPASMTVPAWPASSTSCAPASPGGCCPPASSAAAAPSPAGGGCVTGSAPGCGSSSTTSCSTSSAARASSTGPAPASTPSACAPSGGRANRPEPDRPRQARKQVPPAGRPHRHPPGRLPVGGQHPRLHAAGAGRGRGPTGQGAAGTTGAAAQAPGQAAPGQGLRLPALPAGPASPRHHPQDRPPWHRIEPAARPPPLRGGAVAGVAGGLPAAPGPLRAAR